PAPAPQGGAFQQIAVRNGVIGVRPRSSGRRPTPARRMSRQRWWRALWMLGGLAPPPAALAAPGAPAPAPAPAQATAGRCTTGVQSALQEIACALAIGAHDLRQALVVSAAVSASEPLERGAELAARLTRSVAG